MREIAVITAGRCRVLRRRGPTRRRGASPRHATDNRASRECCVHVDGAWAEVELARDLAVGPPDGDEAQHLELATREARADEVACGAAPEPLLDRLAERLERARRPIRQRLRPELARAAIGIRQSLDGRV